MLSSIGPTDACLQAELDRYQSPWSEEDYLEYEGEEEEDEESDDDPN